MTARARTVALRRAAAVVVSVAAIACADADDRYPTAPAVVSRHQAVVDSIAAAVVEQFPIPAVAVAIVHASDEPAVAVAGVRKLGAPDRVRLDDRWHLGSNTKAMTATMIARLVEMGRLSWDDTPSELLPELRATMNPMLRNVTLAQLLSHRAGIVSDTNSAELLAHPVFPGSTTAQRLAYAAELLQLGPRGPIGAFAYSNGDFVIAAAMAERATRTSWEELMRRYVFAPLRLDAVVGWPAASGRVGPWGHVEIGGALVPHDPNGPERVPVIIGPAGDVSVPIRDYARFLQFHLAGLEGRDQLLHASTIRLMHTNAEGQYGLGWGLETVAGIPISIHNGSTGTFYATAIIVPSQDLAIAAIVNAADPSALAAIEAASEQLIREGLAR
jgi:CubicO group peptidase (beta-lactamase class C family)